MATLIIATQVTVNLIQAMDIRDIAVRPTLIRAMTNGLTGLIVVIDNFLARPKKNYWPWNGLQIFEK